MKIITSQTVSVRVLYQCILILYNFSTSVLLQCSSYFSDSAIINSSYLAHSFRVMSLIRYQPSVFLPELIKLHGPFTKACHYVDAKSCCFPLPQMELPRPRPPQQSWWLHSTRRVALNYCVYWLGFAPWTMRTLLWKIHSLSLVLWWKREK